MKTMAGFLRTLPDPDVIGASEYRLLHGHIEDLAAMDEEGDDDPEEGLDLCRDSLGELIDHAQSLLADLETYRG